jgi:hypothetical protein
VDLAPELRIGGREGRTAEDQVERRTVDGDAPTFGLVAVEPHPEIVEGVMFEMSKPRI